MVYIRLYFDQSTSFAHLYFDVSLSVSKIPMAGITTKGANRIHVKIFYSNSELYSYPNTCFN